MAAYFVHFLPENALELSERLGGEWSFDCACEKLCAIDRSKPSDRKKPIRFTA